MQTYLNTTCYQTKAPMDNILSSKYVLKIIFVLYTRSIFTICIIIHSPRRNMYKVVLKIQTIGSSDLATVSWCLKKKGSFFLKNHKSWLIKSNICHKNFWVESRQTNENNEFGIFMHVMQKYEYFLQIHRNLPRLWDIFVLKSVTNNDIRHDSFLHVIIYSFLRVVIHTLSMHGAL